MKGFASGGWSDGSDPNASPADDAVTPPIEDPARLHRATFWTQDADFAALADVQYIPPG